MANREQRSARAERQIADDLAEVAHEIRQARLMAGLTLRQVGVAAGASAATIHRLESGRDRTPRPALLARHAAAVGMRLRIKVYPGDDPIRDAGQVRLIRRFRERIGDHGSWALEVPIPHPYDQRALDAVLTLAEGRIGLEFYTRLTDVQEQLRRAYLKKRDAGLERMVIVVQQTHANRRALRMSESILAEVFPGSSRHLLAELSAGRVPTADGVIVI